MSGAAPVTTVSLTVNGRAVAVAVEPRLHMADLLREQLNLTGTHLGCEQGVCGACTVLLDGKPQRACITYAVDCDGSEVTTIEGFGDDAMMAELREAFAAHHALQCGFCTSGMLITARDIVLRLGEVPERRIREELSGNLCRCTGYMRIVAAVSAVAAGRTPQTVVTHAPVSARAAAPVSEPAPAQRAAARRPAAVLEGGPIVEERLTLAGSPDSVWAALCDIRRVATCLPGAEIERIQGDEIAGGMRIALGPIKANFHGTGTLLQDAVRREGRISGRGRDSLSGSVADGEVHWRVLPADGRTELVVRLSWRLTGVLAQFSRGGLVQDVVRRLAGEFAHNLDSLLAGSAPAASRKPLGLLSLLWSLLRVRLFGR
jgi:aerobic-type carbon monoxide dehydrogenase small subunit (CoxS/CutS family)/carbon monoxide dehydrogenase subunit G